MSLDFNPKSHRYRLDGHPVPSVTTILNVLAKPAIPKWAAGQVGAFVTANPHAILDGWLGSDPDAMIATLKEVPWTVRDDAAQRGTQLHLYAEALLRGEDVDVPVELEATVENALRFMDDYHIEPTVIEGRCASRTDRWAGTLDLVANGAIWDWKSGKRIYPEAAFQLNAYAHSEFYLDPDGVEQPTADLGISAAYGVHIRDDGYTVYPLRFGPDVYEEFRLIRQVYDINARAEGNYRVPGSGYVGAPIDTEVEEATA